MSIEIILKKPNKGDGKSIYDLVKRCKPLDLNSEYLYLLQTTHFADTCCAATLKDEVVGFVSGYKLPEDKNTFFVWQVATDNSLRGKGLAKLMLMHILERENMQDIEYVHTTISPSNKSSQRVFEKIAEEFGLSVETETFFEKEDFVDAHEDEVLYKIGPIK
jgi:L-2,4-diaminobutyric acid acetyltransferase